MKTKTLKSLPLYVTSPKSVKEMGERVLNLVSKGWCQFLFGEDSNGHGVDSRSKHAVKVCLNGAISRACVDEYAPSKNAFVDELKMMVGNGGIMVFNDDSKTTKKDVINAVKAVIKLYK